jgi:sulfite reductase alpha subunit-like flavoprotein
MAYETGDHLIIYPHNPEPQVKRLLALLDVDPLAVLTFVYRSEDDTQDAEAHDLGLSLPATAHDLLSTQFDVTLKEPFNNLLQLLAERAQDKLDQEELEKWLTELQGDKVVSSFQHLDQLFLTVLHIDAAVSKD